MKGKALILISVLLPALCLALDSLNVSKIAQIDVWGTISDIVVRDNLAYVATEKSSVVVLDISDPSSPRPVGRTHTYYLHAVELEVSDSLLIVSTGDNLWFEYGTVDIFRIHSPKELERLAVIQRYGPGARLSLQDSWLLVDDGSWGTDLYDISDPSNPEVATLLRFEGHATIRKEVMFLASEERGGDQFQIRHFNPPDDFSIIGSTLVAGYNINLLAVEGRCAAVNQWDEIVLIDISDLQNPIEAGRHETTSKVNDLSFADNVLYATGSNDSVVALDISATSGLTELGSFSTCTNLHSAGIDDGRMLVGDRIGCLEVYDITTPAAPQLIGGSYHYALRDLTVYRDQLLGSVDYRLLGGISLDAPDKLLKPKPLEYGASLFAAYEDYIYANRGEDGVSILQLQEDLSPIKVGRIPVDNSVETVAVDNDHLFVQESEIGLYCYI